MTINDGANAGATISYTVTVDDLGIVITTVATLDEDGSTGDSVTVATTGDPSEFFSIQSGNTDNIFDIDSGVISIANDANLDYDSTTSYALVIFAGDTNGQSDIETVTITIQTSTTNPLLCVCRYHPRRR